MNHQTRVYESILELLSNAENPTPLVRLRRVVPFQHASVYAKLEWYNPFGAVKDRVAANLIRDAEERQQLKPNARLVEPTSGNTGMGLAMIANAKGYALTATISNKVPVEKRASLRLFGTHLIEVDDELCPSPDAPEGAIALATNLAHQEGYVHLDQYRNPANPDAHYRTTGPEIWRQTDGKITHFVASLGTCGTITGTARFLKERRPDVRVIGVHPVEGHDIPGVRSLRQLKQTVLFCPNEYDGLVEIDDELSFDLCRRISQQESIIAGPSSAMALAGALKSVPDEPGVVCVVIFPDNAFKYASSIRRHLPELFFGSKPESSTVNSHLTNIIDFARDSQDVIEPEEARSLLHNGNGTPSVNLIDVRGETEYQDAHVPGAVNIPLPDLAEGYPVGLPDDKDAPILTICRVGERSLYGMLLLKSLGYQQVKSVRGGTKAWTEAGYPTTSHG